MKDYWEFYVWQRFNRGFEELELLKSALPDLRLDYDYDSTFDAIAEKVDVAVENVQAALELYDAMLCSRRAAADAADLEGLLL